jgi:predicted permease
MTPDQARRDAFLKLGGVESTKQVCRERSTVPMVENTLQDARFAIRQLCKRPGFAVIAVFMLALGICARVAIFAFVDAALVKPLPYRDPNRLVGVFESIKTMCPQCTLSYPDYLDWKRLNKVFTTLDVYQGRDFILATPSGSQSAPGARVSDGFFRTLGITPILGRDFYAGEDQPGKPKAALLTYSAWQHRYNGDRNVVGRAVTLSESRVVIIGVLPESFHFAPVGPADFWTQIDANGECERRRSCHSLWGVARLQPGVSVETALANTTSIAKQLERQHPDSNHGQGAAVATLSEVILGRIRPILLVLLSGAGLLLLIASVNVAGLLLVRSESRKREMAVRSALGASRGRLVRQFVTEGLVLAAGGSLLGVASAHWVMQLLKGLISVDMMAGMPYLDGLGLNFRVLLFAFAVSVLAALLFSLTPLPMLRPNIRQGLTEGSRGSAGNTWRRLGSKLVIVELATSMVLLVGAGLLGKSLFQLLHVDTGFQPDHLATLFIAAPDSSYGKDEQAIALARRIVDNVAALPGVTSAAVASLGVPLGGNGNTDWIRFLGRPYHGEHNEVNERDVSSGYFTTLGARLLRGRFYTDAEDESKPRVAIINQKLAQKYFPGEDPIGKQFGNIALEPKSMRQIIGVVDDIREGSLDTEVWPAEYLPFNQSPSNDFGLVVRTRQDEGTMLPSLAAAIHRMDAGIVTGGAMTMHDRISKSQSAYIHRTLAWLVGGFASLALLLSVVGVYGVVAYSVSQRTREIGVRMALGANHRLVHQLILKEASWLTLFGIAIGLGSSILATTLIRDLLFDVHSWDIETLAAVAALLGLCSLLASYIPARRAASVNPVEALRAD